jgi:hypothetical protein
MREACSLVWSVLALLFRSRASLEAEILILRHQLNIQRRHLPKRLIFNEMDRLILVALSPDIAVACTRKSILDTKQFAVAAVKAGGAVMHRLGLSETVLVFPEHRAFLQVGPVEPGKYLTIEAA